MEPAIYRHRALDFATIHIYEQGTIDAPKNTVDAAVGMGRIVKESLAEIEDQRPFFDSEHGPIHTFKDYHKSLPEPFDDEYFRHMQWAHLASGGAGGGMRWPNRRVHSLTLGMRIAQRGLARFLPWLDWLRFDRRNVSSELCLYNAMGAEVSSKQVARFGCATSEQAMVYILRRDSLTKRGQLDRRARPIARSLTVPSLAPGRYTVASWNTVSGELMACATQDVAPGKRLTLPPVQGDLALAIKREGSGAGKQ